MGVVRRDPEQEDVGCVFTKEEEKEWRSLTQIFCDRQNSKPRLFYQIRVLLQSAFSTRRELQNV